MSIVKDAINKKIVPSDEDVMLNALTPSDSRNLVGVIGSFNRGFINLDGPSKSITVPLDTIIVTDSERYILPSTTIDLTVESSSALKVFFVKASATFIVKRFDYYPTTQEKFDWLLFCNVRCANSAYTLSDALDIRAVHTVNGRLPGSPHFNNAYSAKVKVIGHRGFSSIAPENTLGGIILAKKRGFNAVEIDLQVCGTGELVAMHDLTVDRTTNGTGTVSLMSLSELKLLNVDHTNRAEFAQEKIPTLDDLLDVIRKLDMGITLDVKGVWSDALTDVVVNTARASGVLDRVYLNIAAFPFAEYIRDTHPDANISLVGAVLDSARVTYAATLKTPTNTVTISHNALTAQLVKDAHMLGLKVNMWTLNTPALVRDALALGVDGIYTNGVNVAELIRRDFGMH